MLRTSAVLLSLLFASTAFAQEEGLSPVKFRGGEFKFTRNADDEISVTFDGKEIYHNYYVTFDRVVKIDDTDVALLSGGDGGNACGLTTLIVTRPDDKADPKVETVGDGCAGAPDAAVAAHEIQFVPYLRPGQTAVVQNWTPEKGLTQSGALTFLPAPNTSWATLDAKTIHHPYTLFDNADVYKTAKEALGDRFDDVIIGLDVSGDPEIVEGKSIITQGCQAHNCGGADSFFAVDIVNHTIYAAKQLNETENQYWPEDLDQWPEPFQKAAKDWKPTEAP